VSSRFGELEAVTVDRLQELAEICAVCDIYSEIADGRHFLDVEVRARQRSHRDDRSRSGATVSVRAMSCAAQISISGAPPLLAASTAGSTCHTSRWRPTSVAISTPDAASGQTEAVPVRIESC
jgi:hypothetical protein